MKTAIQQMMTELNELYPNLLDVYTSGGRNFVNTCHKYLAVEKQQIMNAYECGFEAKHYAKVTQSSGKYYNETYGGNK